VLRTATNPSGDASALALFRAAPKRCPDARSGPFAGPATSTAFPHRNDRAEARSSRWRLAIAPSGDEPTGHPRQVTPKRVPTVATRLLAGPATSSIAVQLSPDAEAPWFVPGD
jgi:hypothetical protein